MSSSSPTRARSGCPTPRHAVTRAGIGLPRSGTTSTTAESGANLIGARAEAREAAFERLRRVLEYEIAVLTMIDHPFEDAVQAFRRINTLGMKLKAADIESAEIAARHSGFLADLVAPFLADLHRKGYTRLKVMHQFRVCTFIAHPDGRSRTPLHELETREVLNAWKQTQKAVEDALNLVRGELGPLNMDLLWSGALLVPVMALCALTGPARPRRQGNRSMAFSRGAAPSLLGFPRHQARPRPENLPAGRSHRCTAHEPAPGRRQGGNSRLH